MQANASDDDEAMEKAREFFASAATNASVRKDLQDRATRGEPPPAPNPGEGLAFVVRGEVCTYRWVRLSPTYLQDRIFDRAGDEGRELEERLEKARRDGPPAAGAIVIDNRLWTEAFWSRDGPGGVEYFVLVRREGDEPLLGDGSTITYDPAERKANGSLFVYGRLAESAGQRLLDLTTRNRPEGSKYRQLAMIVRGKVVTAANINEPLTGGRFDFTLGNKENTEQRVEDLLAALRQ
jgi:hypothetical protein